MRYAPRVTNADRSQKAIWWLASALALTLMALAFLLGRESMRQTPVAETLDAEPSSQAESAPAQALPTEKARDAGATKAAGASIEPEPPRPAARLERRPGGKIVLSNIRDDEKRDERRTVKAQTAARKKPRQPKSINEYLDRMEAIRVGEDAADPNAFAIAIINAGMTGSTEGFDELIADTEAMEREIKSIKPPRSCEKYHETSLEALGHGRAILIELKTAIAMRDVSKVGAIAQEAALLQAKADELMRLKTKLRAVRQRPKR